MIPPSPLARLLKKKGARVVLLLLLGACLLYTLPISTPDRLSQYIATTHKSILTYADNGLANGWTPGEKTHPIEELMARGKQQWQDLIKSKTLKQATKEYKQRYGRNPPKGFDKWWEWAMKNDVKIVDDYDQVEHDIHPFRALAPDSFRTRAEAIRRDVSAFVTHLDPDGPSWVDGRNVNFRANDLFRLLQPIIPYLPAPVVFSTSTHDLGSSVLGDDQRVFIESKMAAGEYTTLEDLKAFENVNRNKKLGVRGQANACPPDSPAWLESVAVELAGGKPKGPRPVYTPHDADHPNFIHDVRASYDLCYNPELLKFHGGLSTDIPKASVIKPMFHQSKFVRTAEFAITPLDFFNNVTDPKKSQYLPWEEKTIPKVFWRGKTTGDSYNHRNDFNWRNSHRIRLHTLTHDTESQRQIYVKSSTGQWELQSWPSGEVNEAYTDVGLTDGPMQCSKTDGTCQEMKDAIDWSPRVYPPVAAKYKYVIDVDGNGWSSRFHRLLSSGSVTIKSTIYPEFFTDWLIPWYHYVPVQPSYSELYLILSYFIGVPNDPSSGHDDAARQIAENARKFTEEYWRWEDMQSYMFRLLLEYIRLEQDDRDAWIYTG